MLRTSKKFPSAQISVTVRIQVPDAEHGRKNIFAVVPEIEDKDFYKLANKNGL